MKGATDPGLRLAIGTSGAGKTYGTKREVYAAARGGVPVIVIDQMYEWTHADACVRTTREATALIAKGKRLVLVRAEDPVSAAEEACGWAIADRAKVRGVALPEAHNLLPSEGRLPPNAMKCVTAWRHFNVALWLDTQRLALLNRTCSEQSRTIRVYATIGDLDLLALKRVGGVPLMDAAAEAAERMARGEPGWHATLGLVRKPPFPLTRGG